MEKPVVKLLSDAFVQEARKMGCAWVSVAIRGREALLATGIPAGVIDLLKLWQVNVDAELDDLAHLSVELFSHDGTPKGRAVGDHEGDVDGLRKAIQSRLDKVTRLQALNPTYQPTGWSPKAMRAAIELLGGEPRPPSKAKKVCQQSGRGPAGPKN